MNKLTNGTEYSTTPNGYVLVRGNRQLHIIAKSANAGDKARRIMTANSFDKLFKAGRTAPQMPNTRYIKVAA